MSGDLAFLIILFSPVIGIMSVLVGKPTIKERTNKKFPLYLCNFICVFSIVLFISFLICSRGEHVDSQYTYIEYPIEKLTFGTVYFNNRGGDNLNESYVIIEDPNAEYNNVVVVEEEKYIMKWLCEVRMSSVKYHVYLSKDIYNRLQDGNTIYKAE